MMNWNLRSPRLDFDDQGDMQASLYGPGPENFVPRFPPLLNFSLLQPVSLGRGTALRRRLGQSLSLHLNGSMSQPPTIARRREPSVSEP